MELLINNITQIMVIKLVRLVCVSIYSQAAADILWNFFINKPLDNLNPGPNTLSTGL